MSEFLVQVRTIDKVKTHSNADALELVEVGGWQCVVPKGQYTEGERIVYFPPDTVLPGFVSDQFGVTKYLSKGRIKCAKLRGEPSFGLVMPVPASFADDEAWQEGNNVAEYYAATKYMPPVRQTIGNALPQHPLFPKYTDIQNLRHFTDAFDEIETVYITEKIHGTNCRVGIVDGVKMAGSMNVRRDHPVHTEGVEPTYSDDTYWMPHGIPEVSAMLDHLSKSYKQVILFGEIYGPGIQSFDYGLKNEHNFRAFDLLVDGVYMDSAAFISTCKRFNVQHVPVLYKGPFDLDTVKRLASGTSTLGGTHVREGVVVKPENECSHPRIGRLALKYVSDAYLLGNQSDFTEE